MKSLNENGMTKATKNNNLVSLRDKFGKNYALLGSCLKQLCSVLDTNEPYPLSSQKILHIYRHDELSLHGDTRRVHYTFADYTGCESQSVDSLKELVRTSCKLIMDYMKETDKGQCEPGNNVDCNGWNIEMISAVFNARIYAIKFHLYLFDFNRPQNELEYELSLEDVNEILADMKESSK